MPLTPSSVQISAVGDRFGGTYFITSTTHVYAAQSGYSTRFSISGLHPSSLLSVLQPQHFIVAAPSHQAMGLMIGIVTDNQDPGNQGRVKVRYPSLSPDHASDWARVVSAGVCRPPPVVSAAVRPAPRVVSDGAARPAPRASQASVATRR